MNIVSIVPYFYPAWAYGGPAKLVFDSSMYLQAQGNRVHVLTSDAFDAQSRMPIAKRQVATERFVVRYFRNLNNTLAYKYNIFFTPGFFLASVSEIWWANIIHMHDFYTVQNAWAALLSLIFNKPYIISVHGCLESARMQQKSLFKRLYLKLFGVYMLTHASAVVASSENEVTAYKSFGIPNKNIVRLQHGVDSAEFESVLSKTEARKKLRLPKQSIIATFLGRIHAIKGLDLLVSAMEVLKTEPIHWVIAGSDDGYKDELIADIASKKLEKKVTLLDTCFGQDKAALFKASDIFVYPSYSEGFSLGILEAASIGLPLVITTGCHFDQIEKVHAGKVVAPDAQKLARAIKFVSDSRDNRKTYGKNARDLIARKYSTEQVYAKLNKLYKKYA